MQKLFLPTILLFSCIMMAHRFVPQKNANLPHITPLALYGEYIFEREQCGSCHSSKRKSQYQEFISLDGIGGKYPNSWHYFHLQSPQMISPYSNMPSYPHLLEKDLDKETMKICLQNAKKKGYTYTKDAEKEFLNEANEMYHKLKSEQAISEKIAENKEIYAIIAYLQQLPISEEKRKADSIENVKQQFAEALLFETQKEVMLPLAHSKHKDTIAMGKAIFTNYCAVCHGKNGEGLVGPNLTDEYCLHGASVENMLNIVQNGKAEKGMIAWKQQLSPVEIAKVVCYVRSLQGSNPENAKEPQGEKH